MILLFNQANTKCVKTIEITTNNKDIRRLNTLIVARN